jgi:hypothetical protein
LDFALSFCFAVAFDFVGCLDFCVAAVAFAGFGTADCDETFFGDPVAGIFAEPDALLCALAAFITFAPRMPADCIVSTAFLIGSLPFAALLPTKAPATPPATAPTGPATIPPITAPVTPPAVCLETVGRLGSGFGFFLDMLLTSRIEILEPSKIGGIASADTPLHRPSWNARLVFCIVFDHIGPLDTRNQKAEDNEQAADPFRVRDVVRQIQGPQENTERRYRAN